MPKRTNTEWVATLRSVGPDQETALADLRAILLTGLPYTLAGWLSPDDAHFSALAEEVVQETLMHVLDHLDSFEGRSQFTTWAHKIAVRVALTELRRRRWQEISLERLLEGDDNEKTPEFMADSTPNPESIVEQAELLAQVERVMMEELTEKQRRAMAAVGKGMPLEEIARRLGTERNALYKLLHDARLKLKRRLAHEGLLPQEILATFEAG